MTPNEKSLIEDLFNRLRSAAPSGRDAEAESAIAAEMTRSPGAAYALVQTVLVQDHALREAHDKIQAAEAAAQQAPQQQEPSPSFLERAGSALQGFGGQRNRAPAPQQAQEPEPQGRQGGGFLQGALQTAAGVAGGALLFEGVRSMFGGGGGLLGGGSSPLGGGGTTINETIINENSDKDRDRDDDKRDARDDRDDDDRDDDDVRNASYDPDDGDDRDDDDDDESFDSGDDGWA